MFADPPLLLAVACLKQCGIYVAWVGAVDEVSELVERQA